ncbi:MAG: Dabb family protein [Burkholderiales bacterium]|nr:Dabb family protein [Burkholderiales bacterium]
MLKHIVMWTLADQAEGKNKAANLAQAKTLLEGCADLVPGMGRLEVAGATPGLDCTCDLVLYSEFDDRAALDAYQVHPKHAPVKAFLRSVVVARQCMDYET